MTIQKRKGRGFEQYKEYFVDPSRPESAGDLKNLSAEAIEFMAWIFASGGDLSKMDAEVVKWLDENDKSGGLREVIGEVMRRELLTRRFDHKSMAQIHPQGSKVGILANLVAAYMNTNTIVKEVSRGEHMMEFEVVEWTRKMLGMGPEKSGNIVSGGTLANHLALWSAREKALERLGFTGEEDEMPRLTILANPYSHYSVNKIGKQLNMRVQKVEADGFKMDVADLRRKLEEMVRKGTINRVAAVVAVAGETETAQVDNLNAIADLCNKYGIHLHVDAAYGGMYVLSRKGNMFTGIERADSVTIDWHKMGYCPYASATILMNRQDLARVQNGARYLQQSSNSGAMGPDSERNYGLSSRVEGSMGSAGVISAWATIKLFGAEGLASVLDHTLDMAEYAFDRVARSEILAARQDLELNEFILGLNLEDEVIKRLGLVRYNEIMNKAKVYVDRALGYYISLNQEIDDGRDAWRFIVVHPYTTEKEIEELFGHLEVAVVRLLNNDRAFESQIDAIIQKEKDWIRP